MKNIFSVIAIVAFAAGLSRSQPMCARLGLRHSILQHRQPRLATPARPTTAPRRFPAALWNFTRAQISDGFGPADCFRATSQGDIQNARHSSARQRFRCSRCCLMPYTNGKGRSENAGVAGTPHVLFHPPTDDGLQELAPATSAEPRQDQYQSQDHDRERHD
jgi:hypothetical protein